MTRTPVVAGTFYDKNQIKLRKQIKECFSDKKLGPGTAEFAKQEKKILGLICPHAGYVYSGFGAAWCYKEIAESEKAELYIIIGTSHMGFPKAAIAMEDFKTPFGIVETDKEFAKIILEKGIVVDNIYPHIREHSIEVQLPFLQYVDKDAKIVAIVAGHETDYEKFGRLMAEAIDAYGKKAIIIASSDFTHYGVNYSFIPFEDDIKNKVAAMDMKAIMFIQKKDAWGFLNYVEENEITICGAMAIACTLETCKQLGAKKIKLLKYYTSGEISGDYSNCVGYASIVID